MEESKRIARAGRRADALLDAAQTRVGHTAEEVAIALRNDMRRRAATPRPPRTKKGER